MNSRKFIIRPTLPSCCLVYHPCVSDWWYCSSYNAHASANPLSPLQPVWRQHVTWKCVGSSSSFPRACASTSGFYEAWMSVTSKPGLSGLVPVHPTCSCICGKTFFFTFMPISGPYWNIRPKLDNSEFLKRGLGLGLRISRNSYIFYSSPPPPPPPPSQLSLISRTSIEMC